MPTKRFLMLITLSMLLLGGCASQQMRPDPAYAPTLPPPQAPEAQSGGAIYQTGYAVNLFSDNKAYRVGDILTVRLVENTNASKQAKTSTTKDNNVDLQAPTLFGGSLTYHDQALLSAQAKAARDFKGEGSSTQSNTLTGNVTVTVAQVLPNGNLVIKGEKLVSINQGDEFLRISGIVRPADIGGDNSVLSTQIANARLSYGGSGALADANSMGWLGRFFQSVLWPF